ncbi:uncharacterized protein LOC116198060 [Punica granatum]|uniref:Enhancer of polycomb-like protein n=1 Tax=Punica granatum TaxID=22663 RepID=A0A218WCN6_PUNGR|nr:uncharacterized protein LOC116198060 [Punica granatum]OWM70293.1 hypothetical protein CDL15_Pgr026143 [Punica granatum]
MPSVGMRRTTRVFGVVKAADGARVLRSGRRLWPESAEGKLRKGGEKDEWYSFVDSKGSGKQIGWAKNVNAKQEAVATDTGDGEDHEMPDAKAVAVVEGVISDVDKMFGVVYCRRRRKRKAPDVSDLDEKKYRIHFSRRPKRLKAEGIKTDTCVPFRGLALVVKSASCSEDSGFVGFLFSILSYMRKVSLEMSELSGFLSEDPIRGVYSSHGVRFLWGPASTFGSGICKLFGTRDDIPMFLANFSAIPDCFRSLHFDIFLKHHPVPSPRVNNLTDEQIDSDDDDELSGDRTSLPSNTKPVADTSGGRLVLHLPLRTLKSDGRSAPSRHGMNTRGIRKRRSSFKTIRARNPSLMGLNKNNGALASDLVSAKKNGFPFSSVVSGGQVRRSGRKKPAQVVNEISTATTTGTTALAPLQDIDSTSCSANLLIIESDKCFREEGATVLLEPSASGEWFLVVKREGLMRYTYKVNEVMKPAVSNRFSHATVWTGDNGWRLEFLNRDDWFKFKDLYKECFDRNKQVVSPTSSTVAAVKIIPVPGVREVPDYEDANLSTFSRPIAYITTSNDEVSRVLVKRTANYDMDCEDEGWLQRFNREQQSSEHREDLEEETFELMIDAFEKAFYYNPHDLSNEKPDADLCANKGRREVVEAVYSYWVKKRKHKRSALIRALQVNQPRKAPLIPKPTLRKKRSFKRQVSHHGRGKQPGLLQALAAEREALEEQRSLKKLEEAKVSASRSLELAVSKRQRAQFLMGNADLAAYRATMALRIAEAAEVAESLNEVANHFLD